MGVQFDGGGQDELGGVDVFIAMEVGVSNPGANVKVGRAVEVAVTGTGDGNTMKVSVGVACGTNSTSEMDNAPSISPTERIAITSAFANSRRPRISSYLFYRVFQPPFRPQSAKAH